MADRRPNILVILTDQQRYDTIAAAVNNFAARTPALDLLARRGVVFDNAFCPAPICAPSRAALVTGLMPTQAGMAGNIGNPSTPLNPNLTTIGNLMQAAGYETVYHGKSHLGTDLRYLGFETTFENSEDGSTTEAACRYWRNRDWIIYKRPFFQIVSLLNPHDVYFLEQGERRPVRLPPWANRHDTLADKPWPQRATGRGRDWDDEQWQYYREFYASKIEKADAQVARLLDELVCSGFGPNTWVIFAADHGDMAGEHGLAFKGLWLYDGQVRVPMIVMPPRLEFTGAWLADPTPGFRPGRSSALVSLMDVLPTCLDLAGAPPVPELWGRSLLPLVRGEQAELHDEVFAEMLQAGTVVAPMRMIRTKGWKYVLCLGHGEELYDLASDPGELRNLAKRPEAAEIKKDLKARLVAFIEKTGDPFFSLTPTDKDGRPFSTVADA